MIRVCVLVMAQLFFVSIGFSEDAAVKLEDQVVQVALPDLRDKSEALLELNLAIGPAHSNFEAARLLRSGEGFSSSHYSVGMSHRLFKELYSSSSELLLSWGFGLSRHRRFDDTEFGRLETLNLLFSAELTPELRLHQFRPWATRLVFDLGYSVKLLRASVSSGDLRVDRSQDEVVSGPQLSSTWFFNRYLSLMLRGVWLPNSGLLRDDYLISVGTKFRL